MLNAASDFCLRAFLPYIDALNAEIYNRSRPDKENGRFYAQIPKGEVVMRNSVFFEIIPQKNYVCKRFTATPIDDGIPRPPRMCLCLRIQVQLPFKKRKKAAKMLTSSLPEAVAEYVAAFDRQKLCETIALAKKQYEIREFLRQNGYVSFIANGSILPRAKDGISPLNGAKPFKSTPDAEICIAGVSGMGFRRGVTVITGGGYSGKSTLLDAISAGIYNHCAGDGRELVISDDTAVSIAAEDGRAVNALNISPFIKNLPQIDTTRFSTAHASGSTSQASNIMEAIENGAKLLLIDEDRSATNFMIRDSKMKTLIKKEPITPFTDRVQELSGEVSTILVIGGSGEYLGVADRVYLMDEYEISDVTEHAKAIWRDSDSVISDECRTFIPADWRQNRRLLPEGFTSYPDGMNTERLESTDVGFIIIGDEKIDMRCLYNLISDEQQNGLAFILRRLMVSIRPDEPFIIEDEIDMLYTKIQESGINEVYSPFFSTMGLFMELPRKQEVLSAICRMRRTKYAEKL